MSDGREESALNMFKQMDLKGKAKDDTKLSTVHQNTISTIRSYAEAGGSVSKFSCKFLPSPLCHFEHCLTLSQRAVSTVGLWYGICKVK
jgi:hypothetical protein